MHSKSAIVIGAGIVGLAMSRSLAERGYKITVFERNEKAVGASVRNFGMIWPVGQPDGKMYERALRSKQIWKQVCTDAGLWYEEKGSMHLAHNHIENTVLNELAERKSDRPFQLLLPEQTKKISPAVNTENLLCGLFSADEMIVEARKAIEIIPSYLHEKYNVDFYFNTAVTQIHYPEVKAGNNKWSADEIYVCSGSDFETLYPEVFEASHFTKCKLQMMRLCAQNENMRIGPALCGGLSLVHYKSFEAAPSLNKLKKYYEENYPDYLKWGIHVMVSQNAEGELTIGDSHEYGLVHDPFDKQFINQLIIDYLKKFALFNNWQLLQSWHGIYSKLSHKTEFVYHPQQGVTIVNGIGGAGMTLSFGLAEEVADGVYK